MRCVSNITGKVGTRIETQEECIATSIELTESPGLHVFATARRPEVLADLAAMGMSTLPLDVTDEESIKECHSTVAKMTGGKLDILVNNA
jgi:NADP-dependent 3-hydroxy acid dehydrogenase YdfG